MPKNTPNTLLSYLMLVSLPLLSSCGDSFDSDDTEVREISLKDNTLRVNESTIVTIGLDYDREFSNPLFSDSEDVYLVVRLPRGIRFRSGTSEIQGFGDDDKRITPTITNCLNGDQYLDFIIDGDDLAEGRDPSGDSDVEITLTIDAVAPSGLGIIQARADDSTVLYGCESIFASDEDEQVLVEG